MEIIEYTKKKTNTMPIEKSDELKKKLRKEHDKLVKGRFEFVDAQGGWLEFTYRFFKEDPIIYMKLIHNEITELPMGIVKHLNNTYKKIRKMSPELGTRGIGSTFETQSRVRFTPVDMF